MPEGHPMSNVQALTMIPMETIDHVAARLLEAAPEGSEVILFGSYARGEADPRSDVDFMVIEPHLADGRLESVRLRQAVRGMGVAMDIVVVSRERFDRWKMFPSTVIAQAAKEGKVYRHAG
jgi:predicted nucleotidyltransferase